jgi:hypothetical protein
MRAKFLMALKTHSKNVLFGSIFLVYVTCCMSQQVTITTHQIDEKTQDISFTFALPKKDFLYKDFIQFSVATPHITLSDWKTNTIPIPHYDPSFKSTKHIFANNVTITITATTEHLYNEKSYLYFTYYQQSEKKLKQIEHPLLFIHDSPINTHDNETDIETNIAIDNPSKKLPKTHATRLNSYLNFLSHYASLMLTYAKNTDIPSHLLITVFMFISGIICIKKSTKITWNYLRTFCTLLGITLIASTVLFLFKTIQLVL